MLWIFSPKPPMHCSAVCQWHQRERHEGSVKQQLTGNVHCKIPRNKTHCTLGNIYFVPCTMCSHKNKTVHFTVTPTLRTVTRAGRIWIFTVCSQYNIQQSQNSWKYDKSFKHAMTSWSESHSSYIWMTKLVPRANYATFHWSSKDKLPTFHTPLYYYATIQVNLVKHNMASFYINIIVKMWM